jgi:hypothetical protein
MTLTKDHKLGLSLNLGGVFAYAIMVIQWAKAHVTVSAPDSITVSGLPTWLTAEVTVALTALGTILLLLGSLRLMFSANAGQPPQVPNAVKAMLPLALVAAFAFGTQACTSAQVAKFSQIEQDVLSGLRNGETLEQIEQRVAADLGVAGPVNTLIATLVVDTIDALVALNVIPPNIVPTAQRMESEEAGKLIRMGGHLPQAMLLRHGNPPEYLLLAQVSQ